MSKLDERCADTLRAACGISGAMNIVIQPGGYMASIRMKGLARWYVGWDADPVKALAKALLQQDDELI